MHVYSTRLRGFFGYLYRYRYLFLTHHAISNHNDLFYFLLNGSGAETLKAGLQHIYDNSVCLSLPCCLEMLQYGSQNSNNILSLLQSGNEMFV